MELSSEQTFASLFPDHVGRLILDGVLDAALNFLLHFITDHIDNVLAELKYNPIPVLGF